MSLRRLNNLTINFLINHIFSIILLIINIIVFILIEISGQRNILFQLFGLVPRSVIYEYKIWQTFTYMFIHGGLLHIVPHMESS